MSRIIRAFYDLTDDELTSFCKRLSEASEIGRKKMEKEERAELRRLRAEDSEKPPSSLRKLSDPKKKQKRGDEPMEELKVEHP